MQIHIWSDVVCPWCYLGKRRFERALEDFEHRDTVQVTHRAFQLDPARPRGETTNRRSMLMSKYCLNDTQVREMDEKMEQMAEDEGLEYHLTEAGLTGNTLEAHQLVHLAGSHGLQDAMLERLYRAYFTEQRSVFDLESLVVLGGEVGLDPAETRQALERDAFVEAVSDDLNEARLLGISGVPFFVVDGRYGISGAQQPELFVKVLTRAWEERDAD